MIRISAGAPAAGTWQHSHGISPISHSQPARDEKKKDAAILFSLVSPPQIYFCRRRKNASEIQDPKMTRADQIICFCRFLCSQWQQEAGAKVHGTAGSAHQCCRGSTSGAALTFTPPLLCLSIRCSPLISAEAPSPCSTPSPRDPPSTADS